MQSKATAEGLETAESSEGIGIGYLAPNAVRTLAGVP